MSYSTPPNCQGSWNCEGHACQGFPTMIWRNIGNKYNQTSYNSLFLAVYKCVTTYLPYGAICLTACDLWSHCTAEPTMMVGYVKSYIFGLELGFPLFTSHSPCQVGFFLCVFQPSLFSLVRQRSSVSFPSDRWTVDLRIKLTQGGIC